MDVQALRNLSVQLAEERGDLRGPVPAVPGAAHLAGGHLQGGERRGGARPHVVVGDALRNPGQHRLGAVQGLELALRVPAAHQGPLGRIAVAADDVVHRVDDVRIGGQQRGLAAVRPQARRMRDTVDGDSPSPSPWTASTSPWRSAAWTPASW